MHQASILRSDLPQILIYQSTLEHSTKKHSLLFDCSTVNPEILAECMPELCFSVQASKVNLSARLLQDGDAIKTYYSSGKIKCMEDVTFGSQKWPLGRVLIPVPKGLALVLRLARHIVNCDIFDDSLPAFKTLKSFEPKNPNVLSMKYYKLHEYSRRLVERLIQDDIYDGPTLSSKFKSNSFCNFFLRFFY